MFIGKLMLTGVIMAPFFARLAKAKITLLEISKSHLFLHIAVNQPFTNKSTINNQLINYKTTAIVLSLYYHPAILDIDTILSLIAMNEQIMKNPFSGIHELAPNPPKMAIRGKESNQRGFSYCTLNMTTGHIQACLYEMR
jgi:hypothetical protein